MHLRFGLRRLTVGVMAVLSSVSAIAAEEVAPRPIDSPECKEIVARLMTIEGTAFHGTDGKMAVFLHPAFSGQDLIGLLVRSDGVHPSNTWYALAAKAGMAVTGVDAAILENAIRKCHRDVRTRDIGLEIRMPGSDAHVALLGFSFRSFIFDLGTGPVLTAVPRAVSRSSG